MSSQFVDLNRLSNISKNYFNNDLNPSKTDDLITINNEETKQNAGVIISKGAQIFRQKLIEHFAPIDSTRSNKPPLINAHDLVLRKETIDNILLGDPHEKIRFATYSKINRSHVENEKERKLRTRYFNKIQLFRQMMKKVLDNKYVETALLILLVFDAVIIGLNVSLSAREDKTDQQKTINILIALQITSMTIFLIESFLNLFIDYRAFFKSPWNIFDLTLTLITAILEIINLIFFYFTSNQTFTNDLRYRIIYDLRVFRILRVLKIISHFIQLRIIIIALTKAIRSVFLISILLFIFAYIFANVGVVLFSNMKEISYEEDVNDCFETITDALLTLFAIMTLDSWWKIFSAACDSNNNDVISNFYIMSWVLLAAFIFQNLFTGAMVNNFQQIREDIEHGLNLKKIKNEQRRSNLAREERMNSNERGKNESILNEFNQTTNLNADLNSNMNRSRASYAGLSENILNTENSDLNDVLHKRAKLNKVLTFLKNNREINKNWLTVANNIDIIMREIKTSNVKTLWPEDTLLYYYGLMQSLMDNLCERMIILENLNQILLLMHDRDNTVFPLSNYESAMKKNN